jgi:hypothetical protein
MGLVTADELRELFDIEAAIGNPRFERALKAASTRLRSWVGDAIYDDAISIPADDQERADNLAYAEAHLAMGYALLGINTAMRKSGIVSTERVEGNVTLSYLSPAQLAALQQEYFETAETIARPYSTSDGTPFGFEVIEEDCRAEAATVLCP